MEQMKLYCRGVCCGEVTMREDGARVEIGAAMDDPGDGLYRAVLQGERGELPLGVMEPKDGKLVLRRKPERCEIARLGAVRRVQVKCAFPFQRRSDWTATDQPVKLLGDDFFRRRLEPFSRAWWRKAQGRLLLALPLKSGEPFPLETIFCFARLERVEGEICAVYTFDKNELPVQSVRE